MFFNPVALNVFPKYFCSTAMQAEFLLTTLVNSVRSYFGDGQVGKRKVLRCSTCVDTLDFMGPVQTHISNKKNKRVQASASGHCSNKNPTQQCSMIGQDLFIRGECYSGRDNRNIRMKFNCFFDLFQIL